MATFDLTPLYRSTVGFDRLASVIDTAYRNETSSAGYPPYDIEVRDENEYAVTIAAAGFEQEELDIQVENGVLTVSGRKSDDKNDKQFLYQGIATRAFERKFNLADHVEVTDAEFNNGLLTVNLVREIPEAMKPKTISINGVNTLREVNQSYDNESSEEKAA
jgi:molecular chaperone IbpA